MKSLLFNYAALPQKRRTELLLRQRGDKYVQTFQRRARARDLAALAARRRHDGQDGLRIHRLPRGRAPDLLAGAAARSYRLRRLAVPVLLCGGGQSVSDRHGSARRVRPADGGRGALRRFQRLARCGGLRAARRYALAAVPQGVFARHARDEGGYRGLHRGEPRMAARLRAVHGAQGGEISPRAGLYVAGEGRPRPQAGGARTSDRGAARRDRLPYFPPVYLLQAVERPACARKGEGHPDHRRHPDLCFRRLVRRLDASRAVQAEA